MKKSIVKFSPHRTAWTFALVMAFSSLIFLVPMCLMLFAMPNADANMGLSVGMLVAMPFFYLVLGYLMSAFGAWIYNQVAKFTGGIEFELTGEDS